MRKLQVVKIPILNDEYCVWVVVGEDDKVERWLRKWYNNDDGMDYAAFKHSRGVCYNNPKYNPVIVVHTKKEFYATLAHEAVHAVNNIFNYIGDNNRGELFAHCVGGVVRGYYQYLKKHEHSTKSTRLRSKKTRRTTG